MNPYKKNTLTVRWLKTAFFWGMMLACTSSLAVAGGIKHLTPTEDAYDCYACHKKATPIIAENWLDSKHGVVLVKCFVCHGQPDGQGSVPWAVSPDPKKVCVKCHDPAMKRMEFKFGLKPQCYTCHPFHQNSLHHKAYSKSQSKK